MRLFALLLGLWLMLAAPPSLGQTPNSAEGFRNRANARKEKGELDGAIADYGEAIKLDETALASGMDPEIEARLVETYLARAAARITDKRDLDGAVADCTRVIALRPRLAPAYRKRGVAFQLNNNQDAADADFAKAAQIEDELVKSVRALVSRKPLSVNVPITLPVGVVAQINDDYITDQSLAERIREEKDNLIKQHAITTEQAQAEVSKDKARLIAELINEQFITQQVKALKLSGEIEQLVDHAISQDRNAQDTRPSVARDDVRRRIARDLVFVRVCWKVYFNPSDREVREYFDTHPERFRNLTFDKTDLRSRMLEQWKNGELLSELTRTSYIHVAEAYASSVIKELTDPIQAALDIPRGQPMKTKGWGQVFGEFLIGCGVVPILSRGEMGIGPCAYQEPPSRNLGLYHYDLGIELSKKGDYRGSIKEYTKAIKIYPEFAKAYAGRGLAALRLGNDADAERDFARAIELDSSVKNQIKQEAEQIRQERRRPE